MDEADDAVGRVAIFSIEPAADLVPPPPPVPPTASGAGRRPAHWIGAVADDPRGAVVLALCLALLLVLGLRLTH